MSDQIEKLHQLFLQSTGVTTDTRKIKEGNIFFALKGANFNGNKFAEEAINQGCKIAVIDESNYQKNSDQYFLVDDVLETLQQLANYHRKQLDIPVIGITGSNGKTTTKELAYTVLSQKYKTHATQGNFNNHIGVPLTLLQLTKQTEIAIIEMGANKGGDIKELCEIAHPDYGIITNIGKAHLEGFGSVEMIKKTKSELYDYVELYGKKILVNQNEKTLVEISQAFKKKEFYGEDYQLVEAEPFLIFKGKNKEKIDTQLIGAYNYGNIISALALAQLFDVETNKAIQAIREYVPENNRSQIIQKEDKTIILDAYNANPSSMQSALASFSKFKSEEKTVILGEMLELGDTSQEEHQSLLKAVANIQPIVAVFIGKEFSDLEEKNKEFYFFNTKEEFIEAIQKGTINPSKTIMIKGSRGNKLEEMVDYLI